MPIPRERRVAGSARFAGPWLLLYVTVEQKWPHPYCGEFVWTPTSNRFGWRALLGVAPGGPDVPVEAVPARVTDLSGLPPAFIVVGALDLFLEEDTEYARRLIRAGVPTELHVIPGAFHGFAVAGGDAPQVQTRLRRDALARAFGVPSPS